MHQCTTPPSSYFLKTDLIYWQPLVIILIPWIFNNLVARKITTQPITIFKIWCTYLCTSSSSVSSIILIYDEALPRLFFVCSCNTHSALVLSKITKKVHKCWFSSVYATCCLKPIRPWVCHSILTEVFSAFFKKRYLCILINSFLCYLFLLL